MIKDSRVRNGVLTLGADTTGQGGTDFACQASNVHVTPSYDDDGDPIETLCGDKIPAGKIASYILGGTSVQDFDDPEGFLTYCWVHQMETVSFRWEPNVEGAPTWTGQVVIVALEEGGDVNTRLTTDWEFDIAGTPARTYSSTAAQPEAQPVSV